jgi:hypothetical protein
MIKATREESKNSFHIIKADIEFLLSHFEPPAFPRRISTILSKNKQYAVYSLKEMLYEFERADFIDCKINAYSYIGQTLSPGEVGNGNGDGNGDGNGRHIITSSDHHNESDYYENIIKRIQEKARSDPLPTVLFMDLDNRRALWPTRQRIKNTFVDNELEATIIDSGNGYHIVLPLETDPAKYGAYGLGDGTAKGIESWKDKILPGYHHDFAALIASTYYAKNQYYPIPENISPANMLLRFGEDFLTNDKADIGHNPSVRSCMVRVPGSYNSKCISKGLDAEVKIVNRWNGQRKAHILFLTNRFHRHFLELRTKRQKMMAQAQYRRLIAERAKRKLNNISNNTFIIDARGRVSRKLVDGTILDPKQTDEWLADVSRRNYWYIEMLLQQPITDYRKRAIDLLFAPYFINVKNMPTEIATSMILDWLARCNIMRPVGFDAHYKIESAVMYTRDRNYRPLGEVKFKEQMPDLYEKLKTTYTQYITKSN